MEILKETMRSLLTNKMRTFLSMLGIIIGVMAVITVTALGQGTTSRVSEMMNSLGSNVILVEQGYMGGYGGMSLSSVKNALSIQDVDNIRGMAPSVKYVVPVLNPGLELQYEKRSVYSMTIASRPEFFEMMGLETQAGRILDNEDEKNVAKVCVIGSDLALELFKQSDPIGKTVFLNQNYGESGRKTSVQVIGVLKKTGSKFFFNADRTVFLPYSTGDMRIKQSNGTVDSIIVSAKDGLSAKACLEINYVLYLRLKNIQKYVITAQESLSQMVGQVTGVINLVLMAIAGISLLVGGIGIMNIMLVSVTERTREIGIKKAIGASRKRILLEFLVESIMITFVAGIIGIVFGIGLSKLIESFAVQYELKAVMSLPSILIAFGVSSGIGLFFGIYPANKASKLSPIEALRYE
ncbi:MAG TPA: ABC transporter permease [Petrotogaceae bacterium]|nr:ABC transporter permease [Petrotogaceae bacterium]HNY36953.1 ABC transporter permease [Petrotogaceae bacterium]HPA92613.1 ABC transporter permease [Petrotogaceae bacterium]HPX15844.1 ABC transporter permease [Petrotogaceae bacterium]HQP57540.1 ABC transporter permease [Petrotogaceae bacterium]